MTLSITVHYISGLYYEHITIVNDDSSIISMWQVSITDDTRVIIYDRHMFIIQTIGVIYAEGIYIIHIEGLMNIHCRCIACTRSFYMVLTSAKDQKLECFKLT